jgi:hypothetical protein
MLTTRKSMGTENDEESSSTSSVEFVLEDRFIIKQIEVGIPKLGDKKMIIPLAFRPLISLKHTNIQNVET